MLYNVDGFDEIKLLGIFSKNREEWVVTNLACTMSGTTIVPFFDSLGPDALNFVITLTTLSTMCIESGSIDTFIKMK
jgi:long-chain acyl-CoA synthetase